MVIVFLVFLGINFKRIIMKYQLSLAFIFVLFFSKMTAQEKKVKINGRIQFDYEFLKRDRVTDWFNGNEFRRVYLSASGALSSHFKYKVELGFAHAAPHFKDLYIKYSNEKLGNFYAGSKPEPTGLDMVTSSKYIPFFERAMLTAMQNGRNGSGLHYDNFNLLGGKVFLQMAMTNNGSAGEGFKDANLEIGENFSARMGFLPLFDEDNHTLIHLGFNFAHRPYRDLKFRPENHMGGQYQYVFPGGDNRQTMGFEFAAGYQSFSLQSEYKTLTVANDVDKNYGVNSFYVMGSYLLTGEHRPYKHGAFSRIKPNNDVEHGGWGAIELLARYSGMQMSTDVVDANPGKPKEVNNLTFGLNWYLTSHIRFMYNYVITDDKNAVLGNLKGHLLRFQLDF